MDDVINILSNNGVSISTKELEGINHYISRINDLAVRLDDLNEIKNLKLDGNIDQDKTEKIRMFVNNLMQDLINDQNEVSWDDKFTLAKNLLLIFKVCNINNKYLEAITINFIQARNYLYIMERLNLYASVWYNICNDTRNLVANSISIYRTYL